MLQIKILLLVVRRARIKEDLLLVKQKSANAAYTKKDDKYEKKAEKHKIFCKYCKANDHIIKSYLKLLSEACCKRG